MRRAQSYIFTLSALVACAGPAEEADADAAPTDASVVPDAEPPFLLSETGLYSDTAARVLSPEATSFTPSHELWSDAAHKTRWILLPPGEPIDTADMDHWELPVGTKLFKQFAVGGEVIETRLIWRTGAGARDYFMGSFLWQEDGADAVFVPEGQRDALGTTHDVPRAVQCWDCHEGEPGRALGFSALQLSHDGPGPTLDSLAADGLLSDPPPEGERYPAPGDPATSAALGYLHANCGSCHNPLGPAFEDVDMVLRLAVGEREASTSRLYTTTVGVPLERWAVPPYELRVHPADPGSSAIVARMAIRGGGRDQMPPLATDVIDEEGVALVSGWIAELPAD
jgi:mono/diheme cytochrome c family protein